MPIAPGPRVRSSTPRLPMRSRRRPPQCWSFNLVKGRRIGMPRYNIAEAKADFLQAGRDRLLASQALEEGLAIVSADRVFRSYGVKRIWQAGAGPNSQSGARARVGPMPSAGRSVYRRRLETEPPPEQVELYVDALLAGRRMAEMQGTLLKARLFSPGGERVLPARQPICHDEGETFRAPFAFPHRAFKVTSPGGSIWSEEEDRG